MQFQNAILTEEGVRILQSGASNNPVVFTRFLFTGSSTPLTAQTVNLPEPTWGNGHVTNYAAGENGFVLYMMATNDTDYGYAYGFGVYGYLQNEGVENEKLLIVANYAGNVTYVSEASGSYTRFHLAITVSLSMTNSVLAIAPLYNDLVSNTAFQDLLERTVTTRSAADPQVGDDQTVRGDKTFFGQTTFANTQSAPVLMLDNDENENNERQPCGRIRAYDGVGYGAALELTMGAPSTPIVYTNSNVLPMISGHQSLGNQNYKWGYLTVGAANVDHLYVDSQNYQLDMSGSAIQLCDEQSEPYAVLDVESGHLVISDERDGVVTITPGLTVNGDLNVTGSFNPASLNIPSATIGSISATSISTQEVDATGIRATSLNAASVSGNSATIGNISTTTITAQEVDTAAAEINALIAATARVSTLTIGGIAYQAGFTHPALIEDGRDITDIPVGSTFLAYIVIDPDNTTSWMHAGTITNIIRSIAIFALTPTFDPQVPTITTSLELRLGPTFTPNGGMDFQVLNTVKYTGGIALVMRIR